MIIVNQFYLLNQLAIYFFKGEHLQHTKEAKEQDTSCHGETLNNLADTKTSVIVIGMYCKQQKFVKVKIYGKNFSQEILARLANFTNFKCLQYNYVCTHDHNGLLYKYI